MRHLLALALMLVPATAYGQTMTGEVTVVDGDSLVMSGIRIRLFGVDAPEGRQACNRSGEVWACGRDAAALLAALVSGKQVRCTQRDRDDYGRVVATCLAGRIDLAAEMVKSGYAIALPQFTQAYVELEARAQSLGIGLWGSEFREPAAWRAANRDPQAEQRIAAQRAQTVEQQNISVPVFFRNCDEARAYGYSSMRRGQPGYRPQLDGDNDGIACEPYRGPR